MTQPTERYAVLRDYPLRLWRRQQQHYETLLREFQLLAQAAADGESGAPRELLVLAEAITSTHGRHIDRLTEERFSALEQGLDRMDSRVPLLPDLPELLDQVETVMRHVDDYCRGDQLLLLPRSPELVAFADWTSAELRRQHAGAEPRPWPGPF